MPNKVDQDATNRIRMIADRGEVDKHSMELTCHGAAPKPGKLLDRTLALATESRPQRRNCLNTFRGHSFRALYRKAPVKQSRLVNHADSGVYGVRPIRYPLRQ